MPSTSPSRTKIVSNFCSGVFRFLRLAGSLTVQSSVSLLLILCFAVSAQASEPIARACRQIHTPQTSQEYLAHIRDNHLLVPMSDEYKNENRKHYAQDEELPELEARVVIDKKGQARIYSKYHKSYVDTGSYRPSSDSREIQYNFTDFVIDEDGRLLLGMYLQGRIGPMVLRGHSVLARGRPVLAAGRMQISKGRIISINNHTGHYGYPIEVLLRGIEYLRMQGLEINQNQIFDYTGILR